MTRLLAILVSALCISACASTGDPAGSNAAPVAEASTPKPAENSEATGLESIEPPTVEPEATPVAAAGESPDDRICRREVRTGTHRAVRVCRTRAEVERMETESKEAFRDLHREQGFSDQIDPTGRN